MRVNIRGTELRFWFKHYPKGTMAYCGIEGKSNRGVGSTLSRGDKFCKAIGRRVSLTRLLNWLSHPDTNKSFSPSGWVNVFPLNVDDRRLIWAEYFKQHRDLKHG